MAPATVAGATSRKDPQRAGRRRITWDRGTIINAIQEWVATYDEPPRAADWNPSSAKWSGQTWRIERYRAGRADGSAWPSLNAAKRPFGGSLAEAIRAAGFEPATPGPRRRSGVEPAQAVRLQMSPDVRVLLDAALAAARDADRRVDVLEGRLTGAQERARRLADERDAARRRTVVLADRERTAGDAAELRAERRVRAAEAAVRAARSEATEARTTAEGLSSRLERSEAGVTGLRDEQRDLRAQLDEATAEAADLDERLRAATVAAERARRADEARGERAVVPDPAASSAAVRDALLRADAARRDADAAERRAAEAERRAATAETAMRDAVAAGRSGGTRLAPDELAALRDPQAQAGPAVLAEALGGLAAARRSANPDAQRIALRRVAEAAVGWRERL